MPPHRLLLLGQPRLEGPWGATSLQPTKPNALGCYLAAQAGRMIPRSRIIATFWEELPEADGRRALTTTLGRLRRTFPQWPVLSNGDLLGWDPNADIAVDTSKLAALGEVLWRGPFLNDFHLADAPAFDQWLHTQRQYWEEQFLEVLHRRIAAELANGAWESVAASARQALQANPLQERFHRALMEALHQGGDRAAALAQYGALQQLLHADLGVEPDPTTTQLRDAILAHTVDQAQRLPMRAGPVGAPAQPLSHHLPAQSTRFIGRQADIAAVKAKFPACRLLTLTGAGGVGKTRLALQAATDLFSVRPDGVWFVELASLTDPELVPAAVASVLGLDVQPDRAPMEALIQHLKVKNGLLVLDNCEHLVYACAELADTLLRHCAELWIMATSREGLGIPAEIAWPVPPLRLPEPERLPPLEDLQAVEAIHLFVDRAVAAEPNFTVTGANAATIARICCRLDGIPLAIELAAALVKVLSVDELDTRLDDRFRLLRLGSRTASARQQTLQGAVDWSYELLSPAEKTLWQRLSIFAGGFTLAAAETVCSADPDLPRGQALELLHRLVDKSLVVAKQHGGERRFRLLETIRQYGLAKLRETSDHMAVGERHLDWFLAWAERTAAQQWGTQRTVAYGHMDRELDNIRTAMDWSLSPSGDPAKGTRLAWELVHYWDARGYLREGRERAADLQKRAEALSDAAVQASAYSLNACLAIMHGDFSAAVGPAERGLDLWSALGNVPGMARCLMSLGVAIYHHNDVERAVSVLQESLKLFREVPVHPDLCLCLFFLAEAVGARGDRACNDVFCACDCLYSRIATCVN